MVFHYFHTYLSCTWLLILIEHSLDNSNEYMHHLLLLFVKDLVALSGRQYSKIENISKKHNEVDPFLCLCVKQAWLCIQLFVEKSLVTEKYFGIYLIQL